MFIFARRSLLIIAFSHILGVLAAHAQTDHFSHPPQYKAAPLGALGPVIKAGEGEQVVVILPGLFFSADAYEELAQSLRDKHRVYVIAPAGLGGTAAPPLPSGPDRYRPMIWTKAYEKGVVDYLDAEGVRDAALIGHFSAGAGSALRLAKRRPDLFNKVIILAGEISRAPKQHAAQAYKNSDYYGETLWRTISRETWNENNFTPSLYSKHAEIGMRLWKMAESVPLAIAIQYLGEFAAADMISVFDNYGTPTLILTPDFREGAVDDRIAAFYGANWDEWLEEAEAPIIVRDIDDAHVFLWLDQPVATMREIKTFIAE